VVFGFECEDDAGDGERRKSEDASKELADRLNEVADDGTSREDTEAGKLYWSLESRVSDDAVVTERRDVDCS
jgi:hypothetical protein